jgi:hypothetical protein
MYFYNQIIQLAQSRLCSVKKCFFIAFDIDLCAYMLQAMRYNEICEGYSLGLDGLKNGMRPVTTLLRLPELSSGLI